ncbi:MAG: GatB/YqeY domain-containing protein [Candidatus Sumerlaeaceae bacterium]|nr:GatB/YqeY domain-containing protein [Candidatus Sumerlaeaceae bacterium]
MDIKAQIQKDRIEALKTGDAPRKAVLDYLLGEIQKKEKDPAAKGDIAAAVVAAYIKSLREFIAQHGSERPAEAQRYEAEIALVEHYLPKALTADELRAEIEVLRAAGTDKKGLIMKALKEKHGAAVDGKAAATLLDEMGIK